MSARPAVWVVGATGYAGAEAVRLLAAHPHFRLDCALASPGSPARDLSDVDPSFPSGAFVARPFEASLLDRPPEAVLLAVPDEAAARLAAAFLERGARVVDLSGAHRVRDLGHYASRCGFEHPHPALIGEAIYGLVEWAREAIAGARLVSNPGCYPTAALLALVPLERARLLDRESAIVVDAKSGVTGAGRKADEAYLFAEVNESLRPYRVLEHRHVPEMVQALGIDTSARPFLFVPHLLPVSRGLLATIYVRLAAGVAASDLAAAYGAAYRSGPFVRLLGEGRWPEIRGVARSNRCDLGWALDAKGRAAVVVSAIDNLLKGAAGQAVQNLNLMFGRPEAEGLPT